MSSTKYKIICWASLVVNSLGTGVNVYNVSQGNWFCIPMVLICGFFAVTSILALGASKKLIEDSYSAVKERADNPDEN